MQPVIWATAVVVAGVLLDVTPAGGQTIASHTTPPIQPTIQQGRGSVQADTVRITMTDRNISRAAALQRIAKMAGLSLIWDASAVPLDGTMSLSLNRVLLNEALETLLRNTGAEAKRSSDGQTLYIVKRGRTASSNATRGEGVVAGRVLDSAAKKGVGGVTIMISGTKIATTTRDDGSFRIANVPAGTYTISARQLGYQTQSTQVTVDSGGVAQVVIVLTQTSTTLTEIVTTATGSQRRAEVSNDVVKIDVDKVLQSAPIRSVTDLLVAAKIPGSIITPSSGNPGASARIRLSGVGSISQNNDPVVIVDGVWIKAAFSDSSIQRKVGVGELASMATGGSSGILPNRLDAIDPATIETIEVIRGPAAATLYGPDAANGVIAITTKRGRPGPARWTIRAFRDWSNPVGKKPLRYLGYGRSLGVESAPGECSLQNITREFCAHDSLSLINPNTWLLRDEGRGFTNGLSLTVDGGSNQITYSITGSMQDMQGPRRIPGVERVRLRQLQIPISSQYEYPSFKSDRSVSTVMSIQPSQRISFVLNLTGSQTNLRDNMLSPVFPGVGLIDTIQSMQAQATVYEQDSKSASTRGLLSLSSNWNVTSWWSGMTTFGIDREYIHEKFNSTVRACSNLICLDNPNGSQQRATSAMSIYSARAQTSFSPTLGWASRFLVIRPGIAMDLQRTIRNQSKIKQTELVGTNSFVDGPTTTLSGIAFNAYFRLFDRISFDPAIRKDFGSSKDFRNNAKTYPRFGTSWLVSDESFFPKTTWLSSFRLRAAMGYAAVQPSLTALRGTYQQGEKKFYLNGKTVDIIDFTALGNPSLEPERSLEVETGFDLSLWDDRALIIVTHSNKRNTNTLIDRSIAPSAGTNGSRQENIAQIVNRHTTVDLATDVINRPGLFVRARGVLAVRDNKVKSIGDRVSPFGRYDQRYVAGYPLGGLWARPVLALNDLDGNGILGLDEIVLGDSVVYVGTNIPSYDIGYQLEVGLLNWIRVNANFNYQGPTMQNRSANFSDLRGYWDPASPLGEQAIAILMESGNRNDFQSVTQFRFQSGSVTFDLPQHLARRLRAQSAQLSIQGNNLGLWTNYRGRDPSVNSTPIGEATTDRGNTIPQPRSFSLQLRLGY